MDVNIQRHKIYTTEQVRKIEKIAIEQHGVDPYELMKRAGMRSFELLKKNWPKVAKITIFCGPGNNGGDGFVIARNALAEGLVVQVIDMAPNTTRKGPAKQAYEDWRTTQSSDEAWSNELDFKDTSVIVDAMLGSGLNAPLSGDYLEAVQSINKSQKPVFALDIPTGLNSDTGKPLNDAVHAQVTLTMIANKQGLFLAEGPLHTGFVSLSTLQIPDEAYAQVLPVATTDLPDVPDMLTIRSREAHKGDFGHVFVVGGDYGTGGAVCLASCAALSVGAGLVSCATRKEHAVSLLSSRPEILSFGVESPEEDLFKEQLERASVVVIGPGLGQKSWGKALFEKVISVNKPLVVDADALNLLAKSPKKNNQWILTPHPGEAARLLNQTPEAIQEDRFKAVNSLQEQYQGCVILKGAGSLIKGAQGLTQMCMAGNPWMATAGTGDILVGFIAGLIAQGVSMEKAAAGGALLHGRSGDHAIGKMPYGLIASSLLNSVRYVLNQNVQIGHGQNT